ncbi:MAG: hypothetical protein JNJ89_17720 [Rubrivivax sp.]|nr:hypothetical protein [Rubrivivax sp.]
MIRPRPARWFELLVARDDTTLALEALAATGAVELETRPGTALPPSLAELPPLLAHFDGLAQRYQAWWPSEGLVPSTFPESPLATLQRCLDHLQAWAAAAEPLIRRTQEVQAELAEVQRWQRVALHLRDERVDLALAAAATRPLQVRLAVTPAHSRSGFAAAAAQPAPSSAPAAGGQGQGEAGCEGEAAAAAPPASGPIVLTFEADGWHHTLAVGSDDQLLALAQLTAAAKGHWHAPPRWLVRQRRTNLATAANRLDALQAEGVQLRAALAALADAHDLRHSLADAQRLHWVLDNVRGLEAGQWLCWVTGWTSAAAGTLEAAVERSGARALLRLPSPPPTAAAPLLLANPPWARPFEVFARALGMPAGHEADPSALLAIAVPLMFGYMFGDVGQGLVIAAVGFALRRRFALARLFIAGGLAAAAFGFVFGSVFNLHLIAPLWVEPLADPLAVLVAPLFGGAALLALGLALSALEAHWRGELGRWLATDAGYVACYVALVAAPLWPGALAVAAAGGLWFCCGHAARAFDEPRPGHAGAPRAAAARAPARAPGLGAAAAAGLAAGAGALGELVERLLQILVNTLSFARVGAFALAHAGLASAIVALMHAAPHPLVAAVVLVLGNVLVIVLEGLVVSIQTTRLVLFEFFTRFLSGQGRAFRPLPPPPSTALRKT